MKLSLRKKILIFSLTPLALVFALFSAFQIRMNVVEKNLQLAMAHLAQTNDSIGGLQNQVSLLRMYLWAANGQDADKVARRAQVEKAKNAFSQAEANLKSLAQFGDSKKVENSLGEFQKEFNSAAQLMGEGSAEDNLDAKDLMLKRFPGKLSVLEEDLKEYIEGIKKAASDQAELVKSERSLLERSIIIFGILIFAAISIGVYWTVSNLANELDSLQASLNESVDETNNASESVFAISQTLANSTSQQATSFEETMASMEQIASSIKLSTEQATGASQAAEASQSIVRQSHKDMTALLDKMNTILMSSKKVEEIISVIDDIAFQTNLLALNASVEAARAGEQGRGFAVVADAVRNLASKTAESAKEISHLIRESCLQIDEGVKATQMSADQMNKVVTYIDKSTDLNRNISHTALEQKTAVTSINQALNNFDSTTQSLASAAEGASSSASSLRGQSQNLQIIGKKLEQVIRG